MHYTRGMRSSGVPSLLLAAAVFLSPVAALAQSSSSAATAAPAGSDWQHVKALPIGTYLHVYGQKKKSLCTLTAIDDESLTCSRDTGVGTKPVSFQRAEIRTIKIARRGHSALIGAAALGAAGAAAGSIQGATSNYFVVHGAWSMIYGFAGLFAGAPIGYISDFSASTVYRAQ